MRKKSGFTLIELLVVIGIIVLLAGIVMPNFMKYIDKAKKVRARADIHSLENALAMYQTDYGIYPKWALDGTSLNTIDELQEILQHPGDNGRGPYLSKNIPPDPYGRSYRYQYPGALNPLVTKGYDLFSHGKDTTDTTDDITSWATETD